MAEKNYGKRVMKIIERIESESTPKNPFDLFALEIGFGWYGLVLHIISEIQRHNEKYPDSTISISQIKEKFGTLRFYILPSIDYIEGMISIAEKKAGIFVKYAALPEIRQK